MDRFGSFWIVLGRFGSFWVVPRFSNYGYRIAERVLLCIMN